MDGRWNLCPFLWQGGYAIYLDHVHLLPYIWPYVIGVYAISINVLVLILTLYLT